MKTRNIAMLGLLTAVALALGYFEHLLPVAPIPGIKLGFANTVLLYALYLLNFKSAAVLMALKVLLSGLLFGGPAAMAYSLAGGVLSLGAMLLARRAPSVSVIGASVCGALAHNIGQLAVACFVVESGAILAYLPVLLLSAVLTGILTGIAAKYVIRGLGAGRGPAGKAQNGGKE